MESANIFGSDEDCRSCESGWTMYLASQSHDHNDSVYYENDVDGEEEEDSDGGDSMDSDASSGPMEATSCLKLAQEIEEQNSVMKNKKKKTNEEMVLVETTTTRVHNNINDDDEDDDDDIDGDNHDYDDGNDSYSVVHSYVGSVRQKV